MKCPVCSSAVSQVKDSRWTDGAVRRRRVCRNGHRFSTWETLQRPGPLEDLVRRFVADAVSHVQEVRQ